MVTTRSRGYVGCTQRNLPAAVPRPPACSFGGGCRLLLRAEAVVSSRIEGLEIGGRGLLRAQLAIGLGDDPSDVTAAGR